MRLDRSATFVGRLATSQRLLSTLDEVQAGRGCVLLLRGERGVGKTFMSERLAAQASDAGIEVLRARCLGEAHSEVLGPWIEMAAQLARSARADGVEPLQQWPAEVLECMQLAGLDVAASATSHRLEPAAARMRLLSRFSQVLVQPGQTRARALWIDDVDLADPLSLRLLVHLAGEVEQRSVLVLVTLREGELPEAAREAVAQLERMPVARSVRLAGFDASDIDAYLQETLGRAAPRSLVERLERVTQGNPFVLAACLELLLQQGRTLDDRALLALDLPSSPNSAARMRLSGLSPTCLDALAVASVVGVRCEFELLAAATGLASEALEAVLREARGRGVIGSRAATEHGVEFCHGLLRESLYEALPASRRAKLHAQVARSIRSEARPGRAANALAFHLHRSLDRDLASEVEQQAERAAARAAERLDHEQAASFLRMALDARAWAPRAPEDARDAALLRELVGTEFAAGQLERGEQAFGRLMALTRAIAAPQLAAEGALAALALAPSPVAAPSAARALPGLLQALPESELALRAQLMSKMAACITQSSDRRKQLARQACELATLAQHDDATSDAQRARIHALQSPDDAPELLQQSGALLAGDIHARDPRWAWDLHAARYVALLTVGDAQGLPDELAALERLGACLRDPIRSWHLSRWRLERDLWSGRWDDARERLAHQRASGRRLIGARAEFIHAVETFQWARLRGSPTSYRADSERMERDARQAGASFRTAFALFLARAGRVSDARERLAGLAHGDFETVRGATTLEPLVYLAELVALLADTAHAPRIAELLQPYAHLSAVSAFGWYMGSVSHSLGLLASVQGQTRQAAEHFERAIAVHGAVGASPLVEQSKAARARL